LNIKKQTFGMLIGSDAEDTMEAAVGSAPIRHSWDDIQIERVEEQHRIDIGFGARVAGGYAANADDALHSGVRNQNLFDEAAEFMALMECGRCSHSWSSAISVQFDALAASILASGESINCKQQVAGKASMVMNGLVVV
jgi:hypothetical protein